nr:Protein T27E4.1 [Haemonchus contortus]
MSDFDELDDEPKTPTVTIAFEYIEAEETFNFYIRRVSHAPYTPSLYPKYSKAVMHIVKGLTRKTWMGRKRSISWEEMLSHEPVPFRTLAVPRCITTVFNEFFTCQIPKQLFHNTLIKIDFCDVSRDDHEVTIAECEYWLDTNPIERFREFEIPMTISTPDLGELEFSLTYLPTAQRLLITNCTATNLRIDPDAEEVHVRAILFVNGRFEEIHKSEHRLPRDETPTGWNFAKKLVFDLMRNHIRAAVVVCQVVQRIDGM